MPGVGNQSGGFNASQFSAMRPEAKPQDANQVIRKATNSQSLAASRITKSVEKQVEKQIDKQELTNEVLLRRADNQKINQEVKKQRATQADGFHQSKEAANEARGQSVSQFAAEVQDRKQRQTESQKFTQNLNNSKLGETVARANKSTPGSSPQDNQVAALASQANVETIDPDANKSQKKADKLLQDIHSKGGEKGKAFVAFAKREIEKGRLAEIEDLIEGYHQSLKGSSLTAAEMVEAGDESLLTVKHMVSADNHEELQMLNQKMLARPDAPAGFKRDQMHLRNLSSSERIAPPKFNRVTKPTKVEEVVRFVSTINNSVLTAPWDKVA